MRVPVSWLMQYVDTHADVTSIANTLTGAGIEVDYIHPCGIFHPRVKVARVLNNTAVAEVPGLHRFELDVGETQVVVVSNAENMRQAPEGTCVAYAAPGASVIDGEAAGFALREVAAATIHGIDSVGILCSARELGIGDAHEGIYTLDAGLAAGSALRDHVTPASHWEADIVLEVAILANIARCQSIVGIAKELAALLNCGFHAPESDFSLPAIDTQLAPRIDSKTVCDRLCVAQITGLQVLPSPRWMQRHLVLCGLTPKNNLVDCSNYVMLAWGQPTHAYDAKRLPNPDLSVRLSRAGEHLHTLSQLDEDAALSLHVECPVICSNDQPVALAGVVGGSPLMPTMLSVYPTLI